MQLVYLIQRWQSILSIYSISRRFMRYIPWIYHIYSSIIFHFSDLRKAYGIVVTPNRDSIPIWNLGRLTAHTQRQSHLLYLSPEIASPWWRGHVATRIADKPPIIPISRFEEASTQRFLIVDDVHTFNDPTVLLRLVYVTRRKGDIWSWHQP